jgi:hypothetical protein
LVDGVPERQLLLLPCTLLGFGSLVAGMSHRTTGIETQYGALTTGVLALRLFWVGLLDRLGLIVYFSSLLLLHILGLAVETWGILAYGICYCHVYCGV